MGWPANLSPLRRAVFYLLLHPDLANVACSAEQLANVLTLFVSEASDTSYVVTADHIRKAFKGGCNDEYDYKSLSNVGGAGKKTSWCFGNLGKEAPGQARTGLRPGK